MTWGVGIIGSGPGVAALHAPTLARVSEDFRLVHVSDAGSGRAAVIADRFGARASTGVEGLLADGEVDVVAICSPPARHAEHVRAALAAGRRAIFVEKPLADTADDAARLVEECAAVGALLVVGTNHLFDPAWAKATHHLHAIDGRISSVTVTLCLSPNDRYHALTMGEPLPAGPRRRARRSTSTIPSAAPRSCVSSSRAWACTTCPSSAISCPRRPNWCGRGPCRRSASTWPSAPMVPSCGSRP